MPQQVAFQEDAFQPDAFQTRFITMHGDVTVDGAEIIGVHSIAYEDLTRDGLPMQVRRRYIENYVTMSGEEIGKVAIEWEDKVSDITPGYRFIRVLSAVRVID
ncbi:MAG: hypothetical protein QW692_03050 [Nitrososphaerota archaeon]